MFTGIVSAVGEIIDVSPQKSDYGDEAGVRLTVRAHRFLRASTKIGDSIAIQGACMTVVDILSRTADDGSVGGDTADGSAGNREQSASASYDAFVVDVSRESLNRTTGLDRVAAVNLEHAMRLGDTLDGHLVSGHVDGMGTVSYFAPIGESYELRLRIPAGMARYMAYKGSVTVNGVSLTVNQVDDDADGCEIRINLIPHTLQVTTLKDLRPGDPVNLEVDMIARYVERMTTLPQTSHRK